MKAWFDSSFVRFGASLAGVLLVTVGLELINDRVNSTTIALALLIVVLTSATFFGRNPALLASFAAMLCFNYFFLPPVRTWTIADPQNLIAWAAFTITAIIAGELSTYARRQAKESTRLLNELRSAFEKATEAEAAKRSEKLKSALLDAVTHDLRTPLTSIKASVTTLLDSEGGHRTIELNSAGRSEFLNIINEETDRLNTFIEGMVQLARVESGANASVDQVANVEEIIVAAVERAGPRLREHHVTLNVERNLPPINGDARSFAEVLYGLLDNAAKYSPAGTTITLDAFSNGDRICLSVTDQGKGIAADDRERVFEKFVRLDDGPEDGLGLGLAIAKGIVEAQGGTISIEDVEPGIGIKIFISLKVGV